MALFTLDNASRNPLKYEQLNSEETVTAASSLPTSAAAQMATGAEKGALQGTTIQAATTTPLRATIGSNTDSSGTGFNAAANAAGNYGAQADTQSFSGVAGTYTPGGNSLSAENTSSNAYYGGDTAQSSTSSSNENTTIQITINNPPGSNPPNGPNPPNNPNPPVGTSNPDVTVNLNTGLLPNVHLDADISATLQPVTGLVENTVQDLLSSNPQAVTNLVTNTLSTVDNLLTGTALNAAIGDIPLLGQGNGGDTAQLINLGLGDTGNTPVAPLLDARILQNLPSLSEVSLPDTLNTVTEAVPTLLQNPLGNLGGTLSGLLGGTGPLAEITLGADNSTSEGTLADLNVLDDLPLTDIPVVGNLLEDVTSAVPLGDNTLADALNGTTQLLGVTVGDGDTAPSLLADVGLLQSETLASVSIPLLGDQPLIEVPLEANGLPDVAATLGNTLEGVQSAVENVPDILTQTTSGLLEGITEVVPTILNTDTLGSLTDPLADTLGNALDPIIAEATSNIPITGDIVSGLTETLANPLDILTQIDELPAGDIPTGDILSSLLETTSNTVATVTDTTSATVDAVTDVTTQVTETLLQPLEATPLEPVADVVSTLAGTATSTVENTVQQTTSGVTNVVENTTGALGDLLGNVVNTVTSPAPTAPAPAPVTTITKIITSPLHGLFG